MTKRIAIAELEGVALDWAVAKAVGKDVRVKEVHNRGLFVQSLSSRLLFQPSTEWEHGGPLIEQHKVDLENFYSDWRAEMWEESFKQYVNMSNGKTPLIAACRAIVAAHNPGGFVEVPDELVEGE